MLMRTTRSSTTRHGRTIWASLVILSIVAVLVLAAALYYLPPAMSAAATADPPHRRELAAISRLILALLLFALIVGLIVAFPVSRILFWRKTPMSRTVYPDAWAEAGRRMETPPPPPSRSSGE